MEKIKLHDKSFKIYIPNAKIEAAIDAVAQKLNSDYKDKDCPIFLSVLNGSFMFTASLMQRINFLSEISFVKLASYSGTSSTGETKQLIGLSNSLKGRNVIIIEDIVDTGNTIVALDKIVKDLGAENIRICTLCFKPGAYNKDIPIDYYAMEIRNEFIVGYGLDYDQLGRQYKDIYIAE